MELVFTKTDRLIEATGKDDAKYVISRPGDIKKYIAARNGETLNDAMGNRRSWGILKACKQACQALENILDPKETIAIQELPTNEPAEQGVKTEKPKRASKLTLVVAEPTPIVDEPVLKIDADRQE